MSPRIGLAGRYVATPDRFDDGAGTSGHVDGRHGGIGVNWRFM